MHSLVPMHSKASNEARKWIAGLVDPQVFFLLFIFLFALQVTKSRGLGSGNETTYVVTSTIVTFPVQFPPDESENSNRSLKNSNCVN